MDRDRWELGLAKEKIKVCADKRSGGFSGAVSEGPPWPAWPGIQVETLSEAGCPLASRGMKSSGLGPCVVS